MISISTVLVLRHPVRMRTERRCLEDNALVALGVDGFADVALSQLLVLIPLGSEKVVASATCAESMLFPC